MIILIIFQILLSNIRACDCALLERKEKKIPHLVGELTGSQASGNPVNQSRISGKRASLRKTFIQSSGSKQFKWLCSVFVCCCKTRVPLPGLLHHGRRRNNKEFFRIIRIEKL